MPGGCRLWQVEVDDESLDLSYENRCSPERPVPEDLLMVNGLSLAVLLAFRFRGLRS